VCVRALLHRGICVYTHTRINPVAHTHVAYTRNIHTYTHTEDIHTYTHNTYTHTHIHTRDINSVALLVMQHPSVAFKAIEEGENAQRQSSRRDANTPPIETLTHRLYSHRVMRAHVHQLMLMCHVLCDTNVICVMSCVIQMSSVSCLV
jgi:hypothetical protein